MKPESPQYRHYRAEKYILRTPEGYTKERMHGETFEQS